jgi:bifunctional non-homologous end joining protein LigD
MAKKRRPTELAFTVDMPRPLPAEREGDHWWVESDGRRVRLSNLDKVFWPEEGYTKGDLIAYYWNAAEVILPYLAERPLTMKRMPDGIEGPYFYEKSAPSHTPAWMPRCLVQSEGKDIDYLMVEDRAALLYVANLGCIEFHPLHSRCGHIEVPDYLFFDLDPFEPATFEDVLAVARHVKVVLDRLGLPGYPKISGATGMQIYVPLVPEFTYDQTRDLVGAIGRLIRQADPDRVTMEWEIRKRSGKVFIDHNMNRSGANIAAVYSVRPEAGATVSTPLTWKEVERGEVRPADFTIATIHDRLARVGDLFRGVLDAPVDIRPALEALGVAVDAPRPTTRSERREGEAPTEGVDARMSRRSRDAIARSRDPKLAQYLEMRDFAATPEPAGGEPTPSGSSFVIQKHNATRLHYDLRLERDGVLVSWAVPRGLPTKPNDRRLAVHTEDHPIEYGSFEGWIPKGHYGAGEVKIFDRGTYETLEWTDSKVSFRLSGQRHRGEYHLVKTGGRRPGEKDDQWLIFLSRRSEREQPGGSPALLPMLAEPGHEPFDDPAWRFEPKLDGVRTLAYVETGETRLVSRRGRDQTATYPELARLAEHVNALAAVVDGEIVATDEQGRPSFERLQQRMNLVGDRDIERMRRQIPVVLFAFDLLWLDGEDLTGEPLEARRERLEGIVTEGPRIRLTAFLDGAGKRMFELSKELGFEGVLAKRLGSRYHPGRRSPDWRKIKILNRQDCVIIGWEPGEGRRSSTLGSLLLGAFAGGKLRWVGQVGTGFTDRMLEDLAERLGAIETSEPPVDDPELRKLKGARWVRPELVCDVEYLAQTRGGKLRAPSFKGLRTDKAPEDCLLEPPASG